MAIRNWLIRGRSGTPFTHIDSLLAEVRLGSKSR
jgi:hypothetical protein